jgi:hypothetical protein
MNSPTPEQLTAWAESCIHINHLNTLIQREIAGGSLKRASELSGRAQRRAWKLFNELVAAGAAKPVGFTEPDDTPPL